MKLTCHDKKLSIKRSYLSRLELDVLRVGNLPLAASQEDLQELFAPYGEIHSVGLVIEDDAEPSSCSGWIYMRQAETAIQALDQAEFKGRILTVRLMATFIPLENTRAP